MWSQNMFIQKKQLLHERQLQTDVHFLFNENMHGYKKNTKYKINRNCEKRRKTTYYYIISV